MLKDVWPVVQGPTSNYEKYVGSRTTFRLLNKKWVAIYASKPDGNYHASQPNECVEVATSVEGT